MARSYATRRLATIAATGALALASLAAAGSASAASSPAPAPKPATAGTVCVAPSVQNPIVVQGGVCTVIVVHPGLLTDILNILL